MNPLQSFVNSQLAEAIGWAVLHSLWQGALAASLLGTVLLSVRSARVRYGAACVAMLAAVAAFAATFVHFLPVHVHGARIVRAIVVPEWRPLPGLAGSARRSVALAEIAPWLAPLWLAGVIFIYARTLAGSLTLRRMRQRGVCGAASHWQEELTWLAARVRVSRTVELLESCFADAPIVIGHSRPVILVPLGLLSGFPPAQIETILLHELAHIRRCDFLVNSLQRLAEGLLFYHPAVRWISGVMCRERENCCDDAVLAVHPDRQEYARALAALEHNRIAERQAAVAATGGSLMNRIHRLLSPEAPKGMAWASLLGAALLVATLAISAAAWQSRPKPQPASQADIFSRVNAASRQVDSVAARINAMSAQVDSMVQSAPSAGLIIGGPTQPSQTPVTMIRVGGDAMKASLIKMVPPAFPETAKSAHISGTVVLHAIIGADGKVAELQCLSGPPLLTRPAMEAVRQWEYRPILLNGEPMRVDTTIEVKFNSDGTSSQLQQSGESQQLQAKDQAEKDALLAEAAKQQAEAEKAARDAATSKYYFLPKGSVYVFAPGEHEKWLNEDVVYIIDDAERAAYLGLKTDEERNDFIQSFWDRRNPTPGSSTNAFKEEHYRRIAYANQHFAGDGIEGWRTDRGHMYIVYGPPDEIDSHPQSSDSAFGKELWLYRHLEGLGDNLSFSFVDRTGSGDYRLAPSPASSGTH